MYDGFRIVHIRFKRDKSCISLVWRHWTTTQFGRVWFNVQCAFPDILRTRLSFGFPSRVCLSRVCPRSIMPGTRSRKDPSTEDIERFLQEMPDGMAQIFRAHTKLCWNTPRSPPSPQRLLRAKCGMFGLRIPKSPPGPPPQYVLPIGSRNRSRTPARDAQQSSHEFASPPEDPQHTQASVCNRATRPGPTPTRKLGCYMLAALNTVPKTSSPTNAVDGSELGEL